MKKVVLASVHLVLSAALMSGCKRASEQAPAQIVQQAARKTAKEAGENLSALKGAVMKGGGLSGGDAQGRPLWSVRAREIRTAGAMFRGLPKQATLLDGSATLFKAGKAESTLQAAQMTLFRTATGVRLEMRRGVTGQTVGPWTGKSGIVKIAAPRADVDVEKRIIAASGGVRMSQGNIKVSGQTLRAQTSLQRVDVAGTVRASSPDGQIEAKTATYDWQNAKVTAQTVTARRQDTVLTGDVLNADTSAQRGILNGHVIARSATGNARAPRLNFDWKSDRITANDAIFAATDGHGHADALQTDSHLRVASARGLTLQKDDATLVAAFADGFDGLKRLRGREVRFSRGDVRVSAPRADATQNGSSWFLTATGGARGQNAQGQVSAPRVTWDEKTGRVEASGGVHLEKSGNLGQVRAARVVWDEKRNLVTASGQVQLQKDGSTLSGDTLRSDAKFQNATLSGAVSGHLADGTTLAAPTLQKRGERFFASQGATARFQSKGTLGAVTVRGAQIEATMAGTAVATGGVTLSSSTGATARAPRATYNRQKNQVTASGGVDFYDPARGLRTHGDTLVADLALKRATLSNSRAVGNSSLFNGKGLF